MPNDTEATQELMEFLRSRKSSAAGQTQQAPSQDETPIPLLSSQPSAAVDQSVSSQLMPLAKQAFTSMASQINAPPSAATVEGNKDWFERNQRVDENGRVIPISTEQGLPLKATIRAMWQRRPEDRMTVLREMFPNSVIRKADTGEPLVEWVGPGGERQDVLLNPPGAGLADVAETVEGAAGQTTGGIVGMAVGNAIGSRLGQGGAAIGRIIGGGIGSGIGGAIEDVAARKAEGIPLDPGEIAREQGKQAAINTMFDFGLYGGGKLTRAFSPFAAEHGTAQFNLKQGRDYLKREWGIDFETTPAEESGSKLLSRLERTEEQIPGSSTPLGNVVKKGQEQISDVLNRALGGRVSDEELGKTLIETTRRELVEPAEAAVQSARDALVSKGESDLVNLIDGIAPTKATKRQAGEAVRKRFEKKRQLAKDLTDDAYAEVRALTGGTGKAISGDPVAAAADAIEAELPKSSSGILKSGVPESLLNTISDMKKQRGELMSLDELTKLKNAARDEIARTEAVPGIKDRWFGMIAEAYDTAIQKGLDAMPTSDLKDALNRAKEIYKTKMLPFDREGLHDVLRTELETGFKSPEQLVNRMFSGERAEHNYRVMKETLGANSVAFQKVRRATLDGWMAKATDELTKRINPSKLESVMLGLRDEHPEIFEDVTKGSVQGFFRATAALKAAGKEITDVDPTELRALLSLGSPTRTQVEQLMLKQAERDTKLANSYLAAVANGKKADATPAQFVASLFNADIDSRHVSEVLSSLSPDQIKSLQKAALYRIATKASENNVDMARYLAGEQSPVQAFALSKAIGSVGSAERVRNEMLLGPDYVNLTKAIIGVLAPREIKTGLFKAAGSMAATGMLEKLLSAPLQYAAKYVQKSILAEIYLSTPVKKALANTVMGPRESAILANALIASEPFTRHMIDVYGTDSAKSIAADAKKSIDRFLMQDARPTEQESQKAELFRFLQGKRNAQVKTNVIP